MAVLYRKQKVTLKGKAYGQWYGRAVSLGHVSMDQLAEEISHSTTVTKADIMAVLTELAHTMKSHLQDSKTVALDGIGSFSVSFKSTPAKTEDDFTANNIKSYKILYKPEVKFVSNGQTSEKGHRKGTFIKTLLNGITAEPYEKSKKADSTATTTQP